MNAADLEHRTQTWSGCIPPDLVARLVELGHGDEVARQAGRGEWFCARHQAQALAERQWHDEALEVLAPYVATGWWTAAETVAGLLQSWGRAGEAITLTRPYAEAGDRQALGFVARLLARNGHGEEAFTLLRPYVTDGFLAGALAEVAVAAGREDDAAALLTALIDATERRCDDPACYCGAPPWDVVGPLAGIREGQGRIDDAIALLRTRNITSVNGRDQLADLLARHGRIEELRAYAASDRHRHAVQRLAEVYEERGDPEAAIAVYGHAADVDGSTVVDLAALLERHGRADDAFEVLRSFADDHPDDWIVDMLCARYAARGHAEDGLAYLDALRDRCGEEYWELFRIRLPLLVACGRREEAIEQARAHPEGGTGYAAEDIAALLADGRRVEEAVIVLEQQGGTPPVLAGHLIELGRIEEAVALLQRREPGPAGR